MADRDAFLTRIREAAARGRAYRVAVNPQATAAAAYVGGGCDTAASFLREWTAVGGLGARVETSAVHSFLQQLCSRHNVRRMICWDHPLLQRLGLSDWAAAEQVELLSTRDLQNLSAEDRAQAIFSADLGITSVDWAIAETGSLVLCAGEHQSRLSSLLPPVHLAIFELGQILPDLFDLFSQFDGEGKELPANLVFVTGPSKTGDIELKLTTGVHGPGHAYALIVE